MTQEFQRMSTTKAIKLLTNELSDFEVYLSLYDVFDPGIVVGAPEKKDQSIDELDATVDSAASRLGLSVVRRYRDGRVLVWDLKRVDVNGRFTPFSELMTIQLARRMMEAAIAKETGWSNNKEFLMINYPVDGCLHPSIKVSAEFAQENQGALLEIEKSLRLELNGEMELIGKVDEYLANGQCSKIFIFQPFDLS